MTAFREESEEHVVHRLEAFSDIVIGFSLAQLTLNLVFPADVLDLFGKDSITLIAFVMTFGVVASMWWTHHRMFTHFFVPTALNIVLNFCSLGAVMFLVYTLQVWLHATKHHYVAYVMYAGSIAAIMLINSFLTFRGVKLRGDRMPREIADRGRRRSRRLMVIGLAFAALAASTAIVRNNNELGNIILVVTAVLIGLLRLAEWRSSPTPMRPRS